MTSYTIKRTAGDMNAIYRVAPDGSLTHVATRVTGYDAVAYVSAQGADAVLVAS